MKSPWKFLAQLTSRRRAAETREGSVGDDADTEASEWDARQTSTLASDSTEASSSNHEENPAVDLLATTTSSEVASDLGVIRAASPSVRDEQTPARHEVTRSGIDAPVLVPESQSRKSPRTSRSKRPGSAKGTRTDMVSLRTAVADSEQSVQSSSSQENFFDEVASLDEEIRVLRGELAQKLHLQNVQLEKMLERFARS